MLQQQFLQRENKSVGLYSKQTEHTMLSELKTQLKSWRPYCVYYCVLFRVSCDPRGVGARFSLRISV